MQYQCGQSGLKILDQIKMFNSVFQNILNFSAVFKWPKEYSFPLPKWKYP